MSAVPMVSRRMLQEIRRLQKKHYAAQLAMAAQTEHDEAGTWITFTRPGIGPIEPQEVVVQWNSGGGRMLSFNGDTTPSRDMTFRRLASQGFNVQKGDKFELNGEEGQITRIFTDKGTIKAEGRLLTGTVWP